MLRESDATDDAEVSRLVSALQTQVHSHFAGPWGVDAQIQFVTGVPPPQSWWLVLLDSSDQADKLGYHDTTDEGLPLGKVFVKTCSDANASWTVTASHELLEMLADPAINLGVLREFESGADPKLYSYEICDPCDADEFGYKIRGVLVSDFLYPAWFESFHVPRSQQFDQCGHIAEPFQVLAGGYVSVLPMNGNAAWTQEAPEISGAPSDRLVHLHSRVDFAVAGSRRERRRRPCAQWRKSNISWESRPQSTPMRGSGLFGSRPHVGQVAAAPPPSLAPLTGLATPRSTPTPPLTPSIPTLVLTKASELKSVTEEIDKALAAIGTSAKPLAASDVVQRILQKAKAQAQSSQLNGDVPDELEASLVLSAISGSAGSPRQVRMMDLLGAGQYEIGDVRWVQSVYNRLVSERLPFPRHDRRDITPMVQISNKVRIAIAGDWGTGNISSRNIADKIRDLAPDHTIHLGDVYYSGTDDEERSKFIGLWPSGTNKSASSFALNGNHEMYSGGEAYFLDVLTAPQFRAQQQLSYFGLTNDAWIIFGLDTAYHAESFTYQKGFIDEVQLGWLRDMARAARAANKRVVLLTHHHGLDLDPDPDHRSISIQQPLWDQVMHALDGGPDYWYWGHVHAGIAYKPVSTDVARSVRARCVGHGGVPYAPFKLAQEYAGGGITVEWAETLLAGDANEPRRALNGFILLTFDGLALHEEFRDEKGNVRRVLDP